MVNVENFPGLNSLLERVIFGRRDLLFWEKDKGVPHGTGSINKPNLPSCLTCWVYISSDTCKGAPFSHLQHLFHIASSGINMSTHFLNLQYLCLLWGHCYFSCQ